MFCHFMIIILSIVQWFLLYYIYENIFTQNVLKLTLNLTPIFEKGLPREYAIPGRSKH